ncbi:hypothetical protein ACOXXX_17685 [Thalassococcus sp. BH17M4-6]|uniref:hypothetical protein n=1 Tax=Thalassococcus sp. BH17M4-6 TaxID=3413148 RepID=UPI003BDF08B8
MTRQVSYAPLLTVDLRHRYYTGGTARSLSMRPTHATQQVLSGNLCRARVTPGRFELWYADQDGHAPARSMPADTILGFTLQSAAPDFDIVTQPDWGDGDLINHVLYFSNKGETGSSPLTLASQDAVLLPVRPRGFARPKDAPPLTLWRWFDDAEVWTEPEDGPKTGHINLMDVSEDGRYVLKAGSEVVLDFYLGSLSAGQILGAVELGWTDVSFDTKGDLPRAVTLQFLARTAPWLYMILPGKDQSLDGATITDPEGVPQFGAGVRSDDIRGRAGWIFRSDTARALAERSAPDGKLVLHPAAVGLQEPDPVTLPLPAPDGLQMDPDGAGLVFVVYVSL